MKLAELTEADRQYVHYTWLTSMRKSYAALSDAAYKDCISHTIWATLVRSELAIQHAENQLIIGWAAIEPPDGLHYVFVKSLYRGMGVAKRLLASWQILWYSCYTERWQPVAPRLAPAAHYAPWKFRR